MKSQTATEESSDDDAFLAESQYSPTKIQRQPFQLLQERQYSTSTTEGSASAQVTPSALEIGSHNGGKNGRQRFFGSGEQEEGLQALPELAETSSPQPRRFSAPFVEVSPILELAPVPGVETTITVEEEQQKPQQQTGTSKTRSLIQTMSSGSSGSGSGSGASAQTVIGITGGGTSEQGQQQQQSTSTRIAGSGGSGVVRRRSWRIHYMRPKNKSLEYETGNIREVRVKGQFLIALIFLFNFPSHRRLPLLRSPVHCDPVPLQLLAAFSPDGIVPMNSHFLLPQQWLHQQKERHHQHHQQQPAAKH
jgi:hypothetical protein